MTFATFTSLPVSFIDEDTVKLAHYGRGRFVCDQFGGPRAREELMSCDLKAVRRVYQQPRQSVAGSKQSSYEHYFTVVGKVLLTVVLSIFLHRGQTVAFGDRK